MFGGWNNDKKSIDEMPEIRNSQNVSYNSRPNVQDEDNLSDKIKKQQDYLPQLAPLKLDDIVD